jgi:hypothetical protein
MPARSRDRGMRDIAALPHPRQVHDRSALCRNRRSPSGPLRVVDDGRSGAIFLMRAPRRMPPFRVIVPAAALAAAGCAPTLELRPPSAALQTVYTASAGAAPSDAAVLDQWWTLYRDSQLDVLVGRALVEGTDARLALARLTEARAVRDGALSRFRLQGEPVIAGAVQRSASISGDGVGATSGSGAPSAPGVTLRSASAAFNVSYELDLFGRGRVAASGAGRIQNWMGDRAPRSESKRPLSSCRFRLSL